MLRAPIWITSAYSTTSSTWRGSISSVTIGSPVSSRASAQDLEPLDAEPLEGVRRGARLERAAAEHRRAGGGDRARRLERLLAVLDRARPGDQAEAAVADAAAVDLDHGRVGRELARDELVRLEDRQHLLDARDSPRAAASASSSRSPIAPITVASRPALHARLDAGLLEPGEHVLGLVGASPRRPSRSAAREIR